MKDEKGAFDGTQVSTDAWVAWYFTYTDTDKNVQHGSYVVGARIIYPNLDGPGAKLAGFTASRAPLEHFYTGATKANDLFDLEAFTHAADAVRDVTYFLDGWIKAIEEDWAKSVADEDSDWQGSAAGAFRAVLIAFRNEIDADNRMIRQSTVEKYLRDCQDPTAKEPVVTKAIQRLWKGWSEWWNSATAWPTNAVSAALVDALKGATLKVLTTDKDPSTPDWYTKHDDKTKDGSIKNDREVSGMDFILSGAAYGDPTKAEFWKQVEARGREIWLANVKSILDTAANEALTSIGNAYQTAAGAARPLKPFPLIMPKPKKDETDPTKDDKTNDIGNPKIDDPTLKGGGGGGGGGSELNLGGGPDLKNQGGPDLKLEGNGSGSSGGGSGLPNLGLGTGSNGTGNGTNNSGLDLIGNPNLGSSNDLLLGGGGSNRPVTVPPGSVITKDGRIVDENGNPVLDSNGNPMVAGPNYTIGPDGTLLDGDGNTVSQYRQLLADRYSGGGGGGDDLLTPGNFGPGGFSYNTGGLGGLSGSGGPLTSGGSPLITGMGGGLSSRALASGGDPNAMKASVDQANAERMAAEKAAKAAAQEQALLTGRQTPTSSGGMPPMMPPGGGMGGAGQGGPNDKDRRRTTWLAEDEETWGTETGAVHGVIGR
ncbi:hypothetical protein [Kitasatospora sp. NPDC058218]|uniref:hypothetical protein n=1 Tax=Kitasatospora sp. NPDC058218 TaxID=3346385 RepID=UPI0036DE8221